VHAHTHIQKKKKKNTHTHTCVCMCMHVCVYVCAQACVYMYMCRLVSSFRCCLSACAATRKSLKRFVAKKTHTTLQHWTCFEIWVLGAWCDDQDGSPYIRNPKGYLVAEVIPMGRESKTKERCVQCVCVCVCVQIMCVCVCVCVSVLSISRNNATVVCNSRRHGTKQLSVTARSLGRTLLQASCTVHACM
jgi:hypothetical protein